MLLSVLSSEAQYTKIIKGQVSPYDTAVAIRIDVYRLETKKLKYGNALIDSLTANMESISKELELANQLISTQVKERIRMTKVIHGKDSINQQLFKLNMACNVVATKALRKKDWHRDHKTWVMGVLIILLIIKN